MSRNEPENVERSMGALEAAINGVKIGVSAFAEGMGQVIDAIPQEMKEMWDHGRTELAAAINHGTDGYVMYQRSGQDQPEQEMEIKGPEVEPPQMHHGGMSM